MKISLGDLRERTGLNLVSSDIPAWDGDTTYARLEEESESKTHRCMREYAIEYLSELGYDIFPSGIGVKGTFTLADFAAVRGGRILFVECLTNRNLTPEVVAKKGGLAKHGELVFIIVGGSGDFSSDLGRWGPTVGDELQAKHDVFGYVYGHWRNDFEKYIYAKTHFPRCCFDVPPSKPIRVGIELDLKRVVCKLTVRFLTPILGRGEIERWLNRLLIGFHSSVCSLKILRMRPTRLNAYRKAGMKFLAVDGSEVVKIWAVGDTGAITLRGPAAIPVLNHLVDYTTSVGIQPCFEETAFTRAKELLSSVAAPRVPEHKPIAEDEYPTDQFVHVLDRVFANKPTRIGDILPYLSAKMATNIGYWIKQAEQVALRGGSNGWRSDEAFPLIVCHDRTARRVADRIYSAHPMAVKLVHHEIEARKNSRPTYAGKPWVRDGR